MKTTQYRQKVKPLHEPELVQRYGQAEKSVVDMNDYELRLVGSTERIKQGLKHRSRTR